MSSAAKAFQSFYEKPWVKKVLSFLKASLPFLLMLAASFLPFVVWFKNPQFITSGDDITWHRAYVYDLVYGWRNGFNGISTGHILLGNLGYNIYTFYAPMSHYAVGTLSFMGMRIIDAWKFVSILSVFLSGVWTYKLALLFTKDKGIAIALGLAYIFSPYRIYCFLYRAAFSEAFAQAFIPLLLLGVFKILKEETPKVSGYLAAIAGGACLILSHPFTALLSGILAVLMILANAKNVIRIAKQKITWVYLPISLVLLGSIVAFYMIPMQQALSTGYYRMSDEVAVWTDVDHLIRDIAKTPQFAGYLYPTWLQTYTGTYPGETAASWAWDIGIYLFAAATAISVLSIMRKKGKRDLGLAIATIISLAPALILTREEMLFAVPLFTITMVLFTLTEDRKEAECFSLKKELLSEARNPEIYVLLIAMVVCFLYLYVPFMWQYSPSVLRKAQFPFRFWGVLNFILVLVVLLVARRFAHFKATKYVVLASAVLWYTLCMGPVDKRTVYYNHGGNAGEPDTAFVMSLTRIGVMNEYMPRVFYDTGYTSKYSNSLYYTIRNEVLHTHKWQFGAGQYLAPAFLEGSGTATITSLNSPDGVFEVSVNSESALVQLPQFYYDGYVASLSGSSTGNVNGEYVDGLVCFRLSKGTYTMNVSYVGPQSYRVLRPFFYVGVAGTFVFGLTAYFLPKIIAKKKGKDEEPEPLKEPETAEIPAN